MNSKLNKSKINLSNSSSPSTTNKFLKIYIILALFFGALLISPPIPIFSYVGILVFFWGFILVVPAVVIWNIHELYKNKHNPTTQEAVKPPNQRSLVFFTFKTIVVCALALFFAYLAVLTIGIFTFTGP
jgi:hypothetical protein